MFFLVAFFFFKQKTAYDLRISDWSSDVCSSDLFRIDNLMTAVLGSQLDQVAGIEMLAGEGPAATRVFRRGRIGWDAHEQRIQVADRQWVMRISYGRFKIGRASCRERVCQYV